jgi:hypothetical protein
VDLTAFVADAAATYGGEPVEVAITAVNGEPVADPTAVDMSEPGFYTVTYGAELNGKTAEASFTVVAMDDHSSIANGGFESGNLAGWTPVAGNWAPVEGQLPGVISAVSYWGEELPYNQGGDFHLDGWNTGIPEPDGWALRSTNFVLGGSGFISLRMGGNAAAVHVYQADGTEIGLYRQTRFADQNFPSLAAGGSWADMGTYVIDLSDYIGQELYIVLEDEVIEGGWAHAFFDEVVTFYETAPDYENSFDTVKDGNTTDTVDIPWQLAVNLK